MKQLAKLTVAALVALVIYGTFGPDPFLFRQAVAEIKLDKSSPGTPVVVELFTSQGCSSCPPADELLGELAQQPGILALEMHIDYWDYIGWKDPYADPKITDRQRGYARDLGLRYVYTPQMVVDGRTDVVGSRRRSVFSAIEDAALRVKPVQVSLENVDGGRVTVDEGTAPHGGATVWLVTYDGFIDTEVSRGENAGRSLQNYNVVREMRSLGTWEGDKMVFDVDLAKAIADGRSGCAIIVQQGRTGPILGAAMLEFTS